MALHDAWIRGIFTRDESTGGLVVNAESFKITPALTSGAAQAAAPAGGTGATEGAYDTAAHRDAMIALVNEMRDALITAGIMKGSA